MKSDQIVAQTNIGSYLLKYYSLLLPPESIYVIGEGYKYYAEELNNAPFVINTSLVVNAFYQMKYFINHFVSTNEEEFLDEVEEMLFHKKYPFGILYHTADFKKGSIELGQPKLLLPCFGKERKLYVNDGIDGMMKYSKEELRKELKNQTIDWNVIIPPRKNMDKGVLLLLTLRKAVSHMIFLLKEKADYSMEPDLATQKLVHMELFIKNLNYISQVLHNPELSLIYGNYLELYHDLESCIEENYPHWEEQRLKMAFKEAELLLRLQVILEV